MFLFGRKKQELIEDIQKYLKIEDLDVLAKHYVFMRDKYGIKTIQKYTGELKPPLAYQALVNILFHPNVIKPLIGLTFQKVAIKNELGEYAFLAAIVGLQGSELEENIMNNFAQAMFAYLQTIVTDKQTDKFTLVIASRITNTLLCSKTNFTLSDKNVEILLHILRDESYKSIHNNIILCILKFCPDCVSEAGRNAIGYSIYEKIVKLKRLQENGKTGQLYCYIPNLKDLIIEK